MMHKLLYAAGTAMWLAALILIWFVATSLSGGSNLGNVEIASAATAGWVGIFFLSQVNTIAAALLITGAIFVCSGAVVSRMARRED